MAEPNEFLQAAIEYLNLGWSVVSAHHVEGFDEALLKCSCKQTNCPNPGKHPNKRWTAYQHAAPTEQEVASWWDRKPNSNIAIVTGKISKLVIVDIDPRHGGDVTWENIKQEFDVPETLTAISANGGQHIYFEHPGDREVQGIVNVDTGIDIRADGNIIIAPPSKNYTRDRDGQWKPTEYYWWDGGPSETPIAPMPAFIETHLIAQSKSRGNHETRKGTNWISIIEDDDAVCREGARNNTMASIAGHFASQNYDHAKIESMCFGINTQKFRPPLDEKEVTQIVNSIFSAESAKRQGQKHAKKLLEDTAENAEHFTPNESLSAASAMWQEANVPATTDWYILRGDENQYILVTPEDEVSLGSDLLSFQTIRRNLLNNMQILVPEGLSKTWPNMALALRKLAREEIVEPARAEDRIKDWLSSFLDSKEPKEYPPEERRDALKERAILASDNGGERYVTIRPQALASHIHFFEGEKIEYKDLRKLMMRAGWKEKQVKVENNKVLRALRAPDPYVPEK